VSEVIIVRTDHYNETLNSFIEEDLCGHGREIILFVDETKQKIATPSHFKKISADPHRQNLFTTPDMMWRCGDYALYGALESIPNASFFWLVEPDVRIHSSHVKDFFDGSVDQSQIHFLTPWFSQAGPDWMWHRTVKDYVTNVYTCMMQLCRLSNSAVRYLFEKRVELGRLFQDKGIKATEWPNDEAFVAGMLAKGGFSIAPIHTHSPDFKIAGSFSFTKPTGLTWLKSTPPNDHLYHPVVQGTKFLQRAKAYLAEREKTLTVHDFMKEFNGNFLTQIRYECGEEVALAFYEDLKKIASKKK